jgi:hypothetical protein
LQTRLSDFGHRTLVLQIGLFSFGHRIYSASTPDSSKFFWTFLVIYTDTSGLSAKNLKLNQNIPFWFISSTHLDLCGHVKILRCLKGEGGMVEEVFCHGLSLYVISSQVIANCWKKVKQPSHSEVNQDYVIISFSPALSSSSYPLIFLFKGVAPKMS